MKNRNFTTVSGMLFAGMIAFATFFGKALLAIFVEITAAGSLPDWDED